MADILTSNTYTKFHEVDPGDCQWTEGFWSTRFAQCKHAMIPYMQEILTGDIGHALNNFKIAAGLLEGEHRGMYWHDGDFYKWIEAGMYTYAQTKNEDLLREINEYISIIGKAQLPDGYLQTQIQLRAEVDRYENRKYHEMYNTGHLLISACAHHKITGQSNFLDIAIKHADLLYTIFYPETKQFGRFGFNQTQIMGLVELYRVTKSKKYLALAIRFVNRRGKYNIEHHPTTEGYPIGDMVQERTPLRDSDQAVGHAVLALYYYSGALDVYTETGDRSLLVALDKIWENIISRKMYLTGAVGQTHYGASINRDKIEEGFIDDYMLPNMTAYNETCANICNAIFNQKMLKVHGEAKYADIMELVLYNSGLSGISLDGKQYFYANPLRMIFNTREYNDHENATESPERAPYLECFCCPPNLVRTIAKVAHWSYVKTEQGIAVILYGSNHLQTKLLDNSELEITQRSNYPWDGKIDLTINSCKKEPFEIKLRIPGWNKNATILINGKQESMKSLDHGFVSIVRNWVALDKITLTLEMPVQLVEGHPRIEEIKNQLAIKRGPIVYCVESPDLPKNTNILDVYISPNEEMKVAYNPDFLGGLASIETELSLRIDKRDKLYNQIEGPTWTKLPTQLIPYYAWSNRGKAEMTVFMPVLWARQ